MDKDKLKRYAEVVIKRGINPEKGQALLIEADISVSEFVHEVTEAAYQSGIGQVGVIWRDKKLDHLGYIYQRNLTEILFPQIAAYKAYSQQYAALLRIETPEFRLCEISLEEKLKETAVRERALTQDYINACGGIQNCLICVPNEGWAKKVYPALPVETAMDRLWNAVFFSMRLDEKDAVKAWDLFVDNTKKRRSFLEKKEYVSFHYKSSCTDLKISPLSKTKWYGGCSELPEKNKFYIPNLPTEEIFTVPDKYSANGYAGSSRPLVFNGNIIDNFKLYFENGKVVFCEAETGEEVLKQILSIDEGASYLGEMALVDSRSPISQLDTVFYNTLYDENASCHMALGEGLGEKSNTRINRSSIHVDFMIGSEDLNIRGQLKDGSWEEIFSDGCWSEVFRYN